MPIDADNLPEKINYAKMAKDCFLDVTKKVERPPIALSVGEHAYAGSYYPTPFGTYGNFSCLVGGSKSMKTFLKSALVACYIGGNATNFFEEIKGHDNENKFVIDIDTEQGEFHAHRAASRVCSMVGALPDFYKPFMLRDKSPQERFGFLEWLFMESEYKANLGLVSVDGAADLLMDVNSLEQANNVMNAYLKWTQVSKAHLLTVIHRNYDSKKATGHLGSAITKKAETVAQVSYDKTSKVAQVSADHTRNMAFNDFAFKLDENFLPTQTNENFI